MLRKLFMALPLCFLAGSSVTFAQGESDDPIRTGLQLYRACKGQSGPALELICVSYLKGFWQGAVITFNNVEPKHWMFCPPNRGAVMTDQTRMVFMRYAETHPETLHEISALVVSLAFIEAFPCRD